MQFWEFWEKSRAYALLFSVEFLETLRLSTWFKLLEVFNLWKIYKKTLKKWKKHSVLIIFPCHSLNQNSSTSDLSFSQVTSVEKRKSRKHFSASAYGLGLKKLFLGFLFSTSVTWEKLKSDVEKFYFRRDMEKNQNKILLLHLLLKL